MHSGRRSRSEAYCFTPPVRYCQQNREVIEAFLARMPGARELNLPSGFGVAQSHGRQLLPQEEGHDGFYYAKLIKIAAQPNGQNQ